MKQSNKIQRIPRPIGVTLMARSLSTSSNKQEIIKKIKDHILNQYFLNNQTINNIPVSIEQIQNYLSLSYQYVLRYMHDRLGYMQGFKVEDDVETEKVLRVLKFEALKNSLNSAQIANRQAQILGRAQGDDYVPFLTEQYNAAIRNLFSSDANIRDLYRMLKGPVVPVHQTANFYDQRNPNPNVLTPDTAILLLNEKRPERLIDSPTMKEDLKIEYAVDALPEVRANYQTGYGSDEPTQTDETTATIIDSKKIRKGKRMKRREEMESMLDTDDM